MSFQPVLRPWLIRSGRCAVRHGDIKSVHYQSTGTTPNLETPDDWARFAARRAEAKAQVDIFSDYGSTQTSENRFKLRDTLHKPASEATISTLLAAGAHFGHAATRMNPNFMPYAYGTRAGITIIDLDQTLPLLRRATNLIRSIAYAAGQIVFIGTRPDLRLVVQKAAERLGPQGFHVGERWLPGTLTNKLQVYGEETVMSTQVVPDLVVILNPLQNMIAIHECAIERVPTIALIDSNVDPRVVMYPIPANDESPRTAELITGVLSIAGREGMALRKMEDESNAESRARQDRIRRGTGRM